MAFLNVKTVKREEDMTHGVDITEWINDKNDTLLSIWDFAGHEEYHVYNFFLIFFIFIFYLFLGCPFFFLQ